MTDLTLTEAAAVAGVTPRQLRHAVVTGKLRARTVGRAYTVTREDLDAWHPPAPGASLDAYWRARGKRGLVHKDASAGAQVAEIPAIAGKNATCTSPERGRQDPTYAPALVRLKRGGEAQAEVIVGHDGPDVEIDFGGLIRAVATGLKRGNAYIYNEV